MFSNKRRVLHYSSALFFLTASLILGAAVGSVDVPIPALWHIFTSDILHLPAGVSVESTYTSIVMNIRLPRVVLAGLVGASLSIAGAGFQGLLKNPLADPYTLGVSSGAAVGAVIVLFFSFTLPLAGRFTLPLVSVLFAFLTIVIVLAFARMLHRGLSVETIVLTGIIFSSFLGSLISLMIALTGDELRQIIGWLLGSVGMRDWSYTWMILPFFLVGTVLLALNSTELNALSFGEEHAQHLGVNVHARKLMILSAASILTGAAVAVSGTIGFVGLVIPHLVRLVSGPDHRHLLPLSMITGAGFLILADLVSRTIIAPVELPVGVITALIGAPVFALLLYRQRRGKHA
ncbi:MAG TPA: iron ABC transporter permease [Bacillales bacterium]|jgi:iron complex transport system permease protein|nr:iron ABC transporter permease [Bacillales bacterium]